MVNGIQMEGKKSKRKELFLQKYVRHDIWIRAKDKMPRALHIKNVKFPFKGQIRYLKIF